MKVLSLFSGIGAFEKALKNIGQPFELVGFSEIDKYAVKSYCSIHNVEESKNLGDITKINEKVLPKDIDLITYGFPCQDISLAGKQKGMFNDDGTQTRSGLFFEALRIIEEAQPKVAIAENVKNLTSKKFNAQFQVVLASLEAAGYNNYWQVLNAKDYGIPQNRERVFIVSIRKDIDNGTFKFPEGFPLEKRLKDLLEDVVDEKYYLSDKIQERFKVTDPTFTKNVIGTTIGEECTRLGERDCVYNIKGVLGALNATDYKQPKQIALTQIGQMYPNSGNPQAGRVYDAEGISPTMDTCRTIKNQYYKNSAADFLTKTARGATGVEVRQIGNCCPTQTRENPNQGRIYDKEGLAPCLNQMGGGNRQPFVVEPVAVKIDAIAIDELIKEHNRNAKHQQDLLQHKDDICRCIPAGTHGSTPHLTKTVVSDFPLRIRKLTPKECFRLMGFSDEDFEKAAYYTVEEVENLNLRSSKKHKDLPLGGKIERVSNTQLYKQAGNSIVVDVIAHIFTSLK